MRVPRCYVSVAILDGYIYALGGFDGRIRQRSAERFYPSSNQWTLIQPMLCPRSDGGAATVSGECACAFDHVTPVPPISDCFIFLRTEALSDGAFVKAVHPPTDCRSVDLSLW